MQSDAPDGQMSKDIMKSKYLLIAAGLLLLDATILGAFGTHALRPRLTPAQFESFNSAVQYQFWQALGMFGIGLLLQRQDLRGLRIAGSLLLAGVLVFCGSIYAITFGAPRLVVMLAPLGGATLMLGWLVFVVTLWRAPEA